MNNPDISKPERGKTLVLVLTLLNTVLIAALSALQVDATIRANQANRDSQFYAIQATGSLIQSGAQSDYDMNTYTKWLTNSQQALVASYTALLRQGAGDQQGFDALTLESQIYQAQADKARRLSVLLSDPAYAPASGQMAPNFDTYMSGLYSYSNELVQNQNDASSAYHRWNNKSDSYVAVLTVLAVAFFLLGVAQMAQPSIRLLFSLFAIGVISIGALWTLILLIF
jgi:hypothetical protein